MRPTLTASLFVLIASVCPRAQFADPTLEAVVQKMGEYVAGYGEKASLFVAVEKYTQSVAFEGGAGDLTRPRRLTAEFAIVKTASGWTGYRDVVEVDGTKIQDRRDRLLSLLSDPSADASQLTKIANESARFNIGPISRNFNVPTATMFFFQPQSLKRFAFERKGTKKIEGVETWEITFRETATPTLVTTRAGKDVPLEGALWVVPADGSIVRSRLHMRGFADTKTSDVQSAPGQRAVPNPNTPTGGREAIAIATGAQSLDVRPIDSVAEIEVTYQRHSQLGLWLPSKMAEDYSGPLVVSRGKPPVFARANTRASYSDFKRFGTSISIK